MATFEVQFVKSLVKLACKMRSLHILKRIYFMTKELRDSAPLCLMHASSVYFNLYFAISQFYTLGLRHSQTPHSPLRHSAFSTKPFRRPLWRNLLAFTDYAHAGPLIQDTNSGLYTFKCVHYVLYMPLHTFIPSPLYVYSLNLYGRTREDILYHWHISWDYTIIILLSHLSHGLFFPILFARSRSVDHLRHLWLNIGRNS